MTDHCMSSDVFCLQGDHTWTLVKILHRWFMSLVMWSWKGAKWSWTTEVCWLCHLICKHNSRSLQLGVRKWGAAVPRIAALQAWSVGVGMQPWQRCSLALSGGRAVKLWCIASSCTLHWFVCWDAKHWSSIISQWFMVLLEQSLQTQMFFLLICA